MSLFVTVQVTKSGRHLEQIHQLTVTNVEGGVTSADYAVTLDGEHVGFVRGHRRGDGALPLIRRALELAVTSPLPGKDDGQKG